MKWAVLKGLSILLTTKTQSKKVFIISEFNLVSSILCGKKLTFGIATQGKKYAT
jgi:hypothetical protein